MTENEHTSHCVECGTRMFQAGDHAPPGIYLRIDDDSFRRVEVAIGERLPVTFDGHVALYRAAAAPCVCGPKLRAHVGEKVAQTEAL